MHIISIVIEAIQTISIFLKKSFCNTKSIKTQNKKFSSLVKFCPRKYIAFVVSYSFVFTLLIIFYLLCVFCVAEIFLKNI